MKLTAAFPPFYAAVALVLYVMPASAPLHAGMRDCVPQVRSGWIRMLPGNMPMLAGFGRIENHCPTPVTIVSAGSTAFVDTSLHQTSIVDGVSQMRAVPQLRIAAGSAAVLKPGGLHLMLMQPAAPLKVGAKVTIEFRLQDGRTLPGDFELRATGE